MLWARIRFEGFLVDRDTDPDRTSRRQRRRIGDRDVVETDGEFEKANDPTRWVKLVRRFRRSIVETIGPSQSHERHGIAGSSVVLVRERPRQS